MLIFKIVLFLSQGNDDSMQLEIQFGDRPPNFCRESYQRRYSSLVGPARIKKIMPWWTDKVMREDAGIRGQVGQGQPLDAAQRIAANWGSLSVAEPGKEQQSEGTWVVFQFGPPSRRRHQEKFAVLVCRTWTFSPMRLASGNIRGVHDINVCLQLQGQGIKF